MKELQMEGTERCMEIQKEIRNSHFYSDCELGFSITLSYDHIIKVEKRTGKGDVVLDCEMSFSIDEYILLEINGMLLNEDGNHWHIDKGVSIEDICKINTIWLNFNILYQKEMEIV